jgi:hypothetical protein
MIKLFMHCMLQVKKEVPVEKIVEKVVEVSQGAAAAAFGAVTRAAAAI